MRRKPGRRMKDMAKRGMVGLLTVSMCLSHVQGIAFADSRVEVGEVEVDGKKITLSLRGDSIMDAAKAAFEDAHLYENEYLGVSRDAKTQAAYRALTDGTNPLYEMNLFSEEEMQALEDAGVEVKALIQMDQEQAEAEGNLKPATESNALRATEEENTQLVVFDPKKEGKKDLLLYKQDSLFANFYDQFSNQLMNQTTTEITAADPASYEINGDEKVTFILINHADDSRVLNLKLNDATLEKSIKLPKAETVIKGVMHTLDEKGIDDTTEPASPSVVPTQEATTADSTTAEANASTEASTEVASTTDATEANAETQLPAESETTAAATETLPQEGQIESENIKSEATEAAPEHKTLAETVKENLAQVVENVKETITAVEETLGVIHSEAAENEGFATESELEKETTAAAAEEKKESTKTEMDTALENERKDLLKSTKASELVDSSVASAKVLQYTLDDLSKAYWSAEIEGEYEVNVFAEKTAFDADDHVKLQLKKLDKPEEAEDGTLATTDDTLSKEQVDALKADGSYENSQSIDIRFVDEDGKEVEPKTPVKVKIKVYKEALPEDADISTMTIKHLDESTGSVQAATVASYGETANGAIKAVDEQGKKVELKSVDADTTKAADEKIEAASVAASTTKEVLPEEAVGVESTFTVKSFSAFALTYDTVVASANDVDVYYVYVENGECKLPKFIKKIGDFREILQDSIDFKDVSAPNGYIFSKVKLVRNNKTFNLNKYDRTDYFNINSELKLKWNEGRRYWNYSINRDANRNEVWTQLDSRDKIYVIYLKTLETVTTIDSQTAGFRMYMTNFGPGTNIEVFKDGGYHDGYLSTGMYSSVIPDAHGFPKVEWHNNEDLGKWCGDNTRNGTEVNKLFVNKDGYYYFNSADYYAVLNQDNNRDKDKVNDFTVYKQLGTPYNENQFYFQRGNFMPYNSLKTTSVNNLNEYDEKGNELSQDDPRKYEALYALDGVDIKDNYNATNGRREGNRDYYFGMYAVADFYQPVGGMVKKEPMVYEFTGDDDLVVYLDDVLILDLGGIHDAQRGSINFATGDVKWTNFRQGVSDKDQYETPRSIHDLFMKSLDEARNHNKISEDRYKYILSKVKWDAENKTFADGSLHTIKFFYMERGAGASNLKLKINIPTIPVGSLQVTKKVVGLTETEVADKEYTLQLLTRKSANDEFTPATMDDFVEDSTITNKNPKLDEYGKFKIKADETLTFKGIIPDTDVKIVEVENPSDTEKYLVSYDGHVFDGNNDREITSTTEGISSTVKSSGFVKINVTNTATKNLTIEKKFMLDGTALEAASAKNVDEFKKSQFELKVFGADGNYQTVKTVEYGDFTNGSYTFEQLDPTKTYRIVETVPRDNVTITNANGGNSEIKYTSTKYTIGDSADSNDGVVAENIVLKNASGAYTDNKVSFINNYESVMKEIKFLKVEFGQKDKYLSDARFRLLKEGETKNQYIKYTDISAGTKADGTALLDTNGEFEIPGNEEGITLKLPAGNYQLIEVKAPDGYNLLTEPVQFTISQEKLQADTRTMYYVEPYNDGTGNGEVKICNKAGVALPVTGGTGTILFSLGGMALMLIALGYVVMKRREEGVVIK